MIINDLYIDRAVKNYIIRASNPLTWNVQFQPAKIGYFMLFQRKMEVLNQPYGYTLNRFSSTINVVDQATVKWIQVDSSGFLAIPKSSSFSVAYDVPMSQW